MIIYFTVNEEGYLEGWGSTRSSENDISMEVSENHEVLRNPEIFKYENGELIKDTGRQQKMIDDYEGLKNKPSDLDRLKQDNEMNAIAIMELTSMLLGGE